MHAYKHAPAVACYHQLNGAVRLDVKFTNVVRQRRVSRNAQRLLVGVVNIGVFFGVNNLLNDLENKSERSSEGKFNKKVFRMTARTNVKPGPVQRLPPSPILVLSGGKDYPLGLSR